MDTEPTYSIEQCIDHTGMGKFQWRVLLILGLCTMSDGVELMLITIIGPALRCTWPEVNDVQVALLSTVSARRLGELIDGRFAGHLHRHDVRSVSLRYLGGQVWPAKSDFRLRSFKCCFRRGCRIRPELLLAVAI